MTLIPLSIPFGVFRNGTSYAAKNRWFDTSLVRWHDGALRSIGGWARRLNRVTQLPIESLSPLLDPTELFRDSIAWRTNNNSLAMVFGSRLNLRYLNAANQLETITPLGFAPAPQAAPYTLGYGNGLYGLGPFGVSINTEPTTEISRWRLDNWGEELLALNTGEGTLYSYATGDAAAVPVPTAPVDLIDFVVTNERIVMAVGGTNSPRQVIWSDSEDKNDWVSTESNHAGNYTLTGSGKIIAIVKVLNMNLILTETDAYTARYTGPPYIYRFDRVGEDVKPVNADAVLATATFAIWLGRRNFWMFDGTVKEVQCDVIDYLVDDVDPLHKGKIHATPNTDFSEIWWYYQSSSSTTGEVDSYVTYNYADKFWTIGRLNRVTGIDRGATDTVVKVDEDGFIYNHELAKVKVVGPTYAETGPIELGQGDKNLVVREVFPDTTRFGVVDMTFFGRSMPSEPEYTYGPYLYNNPTPVRVQSREVRMRLDGISTKWEVGTMRFDVVAGGGR